VALARVGLNASDSRMFVCDGIAPPAEAIDGTGTRTVVVRTGNFADHRRIQLPNPVGGGWTLAAEAPGGSQRVWVSGTRSAPTYFFLAETDATGVSAFYRRKAGQTFFEALPGISGPMFAPAYCGVNGPLFPNPYDPSVVYAVAKDGVWRLV